MAIHRLHVEQKQHRAAKVQGPIESPWGGAPSGANEWDVFLSYASEDRDAFASDLAQRLRSAGLKIWFDQFQMAVGDVLHSSVNAGIAKSRYGVVLLSPSYLGKKWPMNELNALSAREADGMSILPVWHGVSLATIRATVPLLADRLATSTHLGLDRVTSDLLRVIQVG